MDLALLLFIVFAIPASCLIGFVVCICIGLKRGYRQRKLYKINRDYQPPMRTVYDSGARL